MMGEGQDGRKRCEWCLGHPLYIAYHDKEWGVPLRDDRRLFEMLILEGCQAGLSWLTVLRKRENYRQAYDDFDFNKIASYDEKKYEQLLLNPGIIRNRLKIRASIANAQAFIKLCGEKGDFASYLWSFTDGRQIVNSVSSMSELPAKTALSDSISKDLKRRGFTFVGSTIIYAFLQSVGVVDDHLDSCWRKGAGAVRLPKG